MDICNHEFENENCTNCANGLPCSAYECAKTQGKLKEYCHKKAEEIHNKYYQQGRADGYNKAIDDFAINIIGHFHFVISEEEYIWKLAEQLKVGGKNENGI